MIRVLIPLDKEFYLFYAECKKLYENVQVEIHDTNSFEFICTNTFFYMFLDDTGRIVFNEVNTIPGFTTHSRFPNMMKAVHISFEQIISIAIDKAVRK